MRREVFPLPPGHDQYGLISRYIKHFGGPVHELKDRTRDGGARVYFIATSNDEFILVHAECKRENAADTRPLEHVADVLEAFEHKHPPGF
jgi:phage-related protein